MTRLRKQHRAVQPAAHEHGERFGRRDIEFINAVRRIMHEQAQLRMIGGGDFFVGLIFRSRRRNPRLMIQALGLLHQARLFLLPQRVGDLWIVEDVIPLFVVADEVPQPGETVVVAAATGPVGSAVGQIAKLKGARAVGIAGGPEKCAYVKDSLGFDDCLDHRDPDLAAKLKAACPKGIDVYFENVGGAVFDAVFPLLNAFARVPVCGLIAHYNDFEAPPAPKWAGLMMRQVLVKRLTIRGFIVSDFAARHDDFLRDMSTWFREGRLRHHESVSEGLASAPEAFIGMLKGKNLGKQLVQVGPDNSYDV